VHPSELASSFHVWSEALIVQTLRRVDFLKGRSRATVETLIDTTGAVGLLRNITR
jgi:hypothetical protein